MNSEQLFKKTLEGVKKASEKPFFDGDVLNIKSDPLGNLFEKIGEDNNESKSESEENELLTMEKFREVLYMSDNEF